MRERERGGGETGQVSSSGALGRRLGLLEGGVVGGGGGVGLAQLPCFVLTASRLSLLTHLLLSSLLFLSASLRPLPATGRWFQQPGRPSKTPNLPPLPPPQPSESPCVRLRVFSLQYKQVMNLQKDSGIVNERRGDKGRGGKVKVQFCR